MNPPTQHTQSSLRLSLVPIHFRFRDVTPYHRARRLVPHAQAALIASKRRLGQKNGGGGGAPAGAQRGEMVDGDNDGIDSEVGHALRRALARRIRAFFAEWLTPRGRHLPKGETFVVSEDPVLTGMRADGRMTLSQQGVALGLISVQIELSLRLRRALKEDAEALASFTLAITGAWAECCGATAL